MTRFEVIASLSGYSDLPSWIKYFRPKYSPVGYLYGVPPLNEDGDIELDIVILDTFTFNTTIDRIKYRIINREGIS